MQYQIKLFFRERLFFTTLYQYIFLLILVYFASTNFKLQPKIIYWGTILLLCAMDENFLTHLFSLFQGELRSLIFYPFNIKQYLFGKELQWACFFLVRIIGLSFIIKTIHWYNWIDYLIILPLIYSVAILISGLMITYNIQFLWKVLFYLLLTYAVILTYYFSSHWILKILGIIIFFSLNAGAIYISQNFLKNCEEVVYGSYSYSEFN